MIRNHALRFDTQFLQSLLSGIGWQDRNRIRMPKAKQTHREGIAVLGVQQPAACASRPDLLRKGSDVPGELQP